MNGKCIDCCLSITGGEYLIISPPLFFFWHACIYMYLLCLVLCTFRVIMTILNRIQVPKTGFGKQLAEYNRWYHFCQNHPQFESSGGFKGTSFSVTRTRDINWFPKLLVKALSTPVMWNNCHLLGMLLVRQEKNRNLQGILASRRISF